MLSFNRQPPLVLLFVALLMGCTGDLDGTGSDAQQTPDAQMDIADAGTDTETDAPGANMAPTAVISFTPEEGAAPLLVTFDGGGSSDPDGEIASFSWDVDGNAFDTATFENTFAEGGCIMVSLTVTDDDGATDTATATLVVSSGSTDVPSITFDSVPYPSAVLPRDQATDEGTASFVGTVDSEGAGRLVAVVSSGEEEISTTTQPLCGDAPYAFSLDAAIPSELRSFNVQVFLERSGSRAMITEVTDLVAGDIFVIQGQSNAVSGTYSDDGGENDSEFVRAFGRYTEDAAQTDSDRTWRKSLDVGERPYFGQWPLRMASALSARHETPIGILNGAHGGRPIDFFTRNDAEPTDLSTNYGRLYTRLINAGLTESIRAILWYQGESDGGNWMEHRDGFQALYEDWLVDFPSIERTYVTQLRAGCGSNLIRTQEVQRTWADAIPEISHMSTTALNGHDGCHYFYEEGYRELGDRYAALVGRDLYGEDFDQDIDAPNPMDAAFRAGGTEVVVQMRNAESTLSYEAGAEADFRFEGSGATLTAGRVDGSQLILTVSGDASGATGLTYTGRPQSGQWVTNERGIGLLAFFDLPIAAE